MNRADLESADREILASIIAHGEARLESQSTFADAQDQRSSVLVGASTALAAASAAIAASAGPMPVIIGSLIAAFGFACAAGISLEGHKSEGFEAPGWFPEDFSDDLAAKRSLHELEVDWAIALQERLESNSRALDRRGRKANLASRTLYLTPLAAVLVALVMRALS